MKSVLVPIDRLRHLFLVSSIFILGKAIPSVNHCLKK